MFPMKVRVTKVVFLLHASKLLGSPGLSHVAQVYGTVEMLGHRRNVWNRKGQHPLSSLKPPHARRKHSMRVPKGHGTSKQPHC